jgi:HlyD family secretion protein
MNPKTKKIINWIVVVIVIFAIAGLGYGQYRKSLVDNADYVTAKVERGDLSQTVSATGTIKPLTKVELNFKNTGKITAINVQKGDKVNEGDILARQDDASFRLSVQQAQANLTSAIATLNQMKAGASDEDIEVAQKNVASAQTAYDNAVKNLETVRKKTAEDIKTYEEAVSAAETALVDKNTNLNDVKNTYSQNIANIESSAITAMSSDIFTAISALDTVNNALTNDDSFTMQTNNNYMSQLDSSYLISAENTYDEATALINRLEDRVSALEDGINSDVNDTLNSSISALNKVKQALSLTFSALQNTVTSTNYTQTEVDSNKSSVSTSKASVETAIDELQTAQQNLIDANITYNTQVNTAQASVNAAQDNLTTAQANLRAAEANRDLQISNAEADIDSKLAALNLAKSQLDLKKAPPRSVDLASQEAQVEQYRAALALAQENLENTILKSPIDGTVTNINYEIGEQSSATEPVIVLVSEGNYEIEVDISEADIVKIENGDSVKVTFDALGEEEEFSAKVIFIDPAQTVISDVVYYQVKIALESGSNENFSKIKPGMTANIDIMTDYKENILMIPARAVQQKNGKKYVRVLGRRGDEQSVKEVEVKVGITGDDGLVEILSGVDEGQEVVTFVKNEKK